LLDVALEVARPRVEVIRQGNGSHHGLSNSVAWRQRMGTAKYVCKDSVESSVSLSVVVLLPSTQAMIYAPICMRVCIRMNSGRDVNL
jgi:hypothetical protein